ncbi:class I tRNA ligase family protein [Flavobacterium sp. CS20]|uniref:class I tRNA ligase family protein n=1 Tax=Flavobacterium sp. CS20 TaxID=2775246 RepID=UPI001B39F622|nr:class I tRNA ligase family protein [Flavobacterium sp. CS20]QTY27859.1 class I tRNA ligase family protein [Flavobacterium sp. CS20]
MGKSFPEYQGLNLVETADEILDYWQKHEVFKKSVEQKPEDKPFIFFEGYPSANGLPGIHHVMARTIKDIFCRYKTQKGYRVDRKAGWDTHGLPVELSVEKELGITKEDIGNKISVEDYNVACKKTVMRYTDVWNDLTKKMGYWVDMNNPYITYTPKYMESVWWLLAQIYKKGLIYKGYTIQPYSPKAGTGLSSHELNQPGTYQDVSDTTVTAQFKSPIKSPLTPEGGTAVNSVAKAFGLKVLPFGEDLDGAWAHFLAWTTTPWTLPSNTALTVGKKIDYVLVATYNQYTFEPIYVVLAKDLVNNQFSKKYFEVENADDLKNYTKEDKKIPYQIIANCKGEDLLEIRYEQLLPYAKPFHNPENAFRVIAGDFVTTEDGTGIVHTAPTFGADDALVAKQAQPEVPGLLVKDDNDNLVPLVDLKGKFRPEMGEFAGKYVKNEYYEDGKAPEKSVDVELAIKLKEENKAFKVEKYVHSYPNCWRTDKPILYYPLDSWFIKVTEFKDKMVELNKTINWKPKSTGEGRFGNWLANANDWNLSRSRYWGIPLPIWRTEDGKEEKIIDSISTLKQEINKSVKAGFMSENPFADFKIDDFSDENYTDIDIHKNIVDDIILVSNQGQPMKREADLIDVWFDSGSMPYAQWHYPFEKPPKSPEGGLSDSPGYQTARKSSYHLLKEKAKSRKNNPTQAEEVLWECLKGKKLGGYKFRREHVIDEYIADFVCLDKKLIVEVDGGYHNDPKIRENDEFRSKFLKENFGYNVIRFTNEEVLGKIDLVIDKIEEALIKSPLRGQGGFSADFIAEGVDQTRGWFYTLHAIATMVFEDVAYKNVVSNGLVLDKNGQKMSKRLGNAVDPFETLKTYGPDATRWYMISNANPWDNLKFDLNGIGEVQRKFFGTLYNTYSFFTLYANIDNFQYKENDVPLEQRPEIDRWILSELHTLIQDVDAFYADYEPTKATRAISDFVQENLSNWYVRLSRRRFWKGDYEQDKISAYQTLFQCLLDISKLIAPVAPFFADRLYQDLTSVLNKDVPESVHLADFPKSNTGFINKSLEDKMHTAQVISSLVLSLRKKEKIKVRQPLQRIMIPVLDQDFKADVEAVADLIKSEVNVKTIEFIDDTSDLLIKSVKPNFKVLYPKFGKNMKFAVKAINKFTKADIAKIEKDGQIEVEINGKPEVLSIDEVEITSEDIEGWLVASQNNITVALDIHIDDKLKNEGIARELVNRIQNLRKDSDLNVTDHIEISIQKDNNIVKAVEENLTYIKRETLTKNITFANQIENGREIEFDDVHTVITLKKI